MVKYFMFQLIVAVLCGCCKLIWCGSWVYRVFPDGWFKFALISHREWSSTIRLAHFTDPAVCWKRGAGTLHGINQVDFWFRSGQSPFFNKLREGFGPLNNPLLKMSERAGAPSDWVPLGLSCFSSTLSPWFLFLKGWSVILIDIFFLRAAVPDTNSNSRFLLNTPTWRVLNEFF